jgi:ABC-type multidrug transport system ATPase subunit
MKMLACLVRPDSGVATIDGRSVYTDGDHIRRILGYMPDFIGVYDDLTVDEYLQFFAGAYRIPRKRRRPLVAEVLELTDLTFKRDALVNSLSRGMSQRLGIARVLIHEPRVLLLDEPTSALDPVAARQVRRALASLAQERRRTIVLCTHDLSEAELLCDRVVVLEEGRIVADGRPVDLAAEHGSGGVQVEVALADVDRARQIVAELAPGEVDRDGNGRLRATGVGRDLLPVLVQRLAAAELTVYEVRRLDPSLEDVYLALHASRNVASGPAMAGTDAAVRP